MLEIFTPYFFSGLKKIRIGSNNDGGYVICNNFQNYDIIISGGAGDNISFENDLIKTYPNIQCHLFDHTVDSKIENSNIIFYKLRLDKDNTIFFDLIRSSYNIFLKLDIEGGEYEILSMLDSSDLERIKQIIIEIHNPFNDEKIKLVKKLFYHHFLIHLHANNNSQLVLYKNTNIPEVMELSLLRKKDLSSDIFLHKNIFPLPTSIDQPNNKNITDFKINYYPFVCEHGFEFVFGS